MGFKNYDKYLYKKVIIVCTDHKEFIGDVVSVEGAMNLLNSRGVYGGNGNRLYDG